MLLIAGLKMREIVKCRGLKSQGLLHLPYSTTVNVKSLEISLHETTCSCYWSPSNPTTTVLLPRPILGLAVHFSCSASSSSWLQFENLLYNIDFTCTFHYMKTQPEIKARRWSTLAVSLHYHAMYILLHYEIALLNSVYKSGSVILYIFGDISTLPHVQHTHRVFAILSIVIWETSTAVCRVGIAVARDLLTWRFEGKTKDVQNTFAC